MDHRFAILPRGDRGLLPPLAPFPGTPDLTPLPPLPDPSPLLFQSVQRSSFSAHRNQCMGGFGRAGSGQHRSFPDTASRFFRVAICPVTSPSTPSFCTLPSGPDIPGNARQPRSPSTRWRTARAPEHQSTRARVLGQGRKAPGRRGAVRTRVVGSFSVPRELGGSAPRALEPDPGQGSQGTEGEGQR